VVVDTEVGEFIGRVALTPRRREPYTEPYDILRIVTQRDAREDDENRELARGIRNEAQKLARDHRIENVQFIGCDVSLDGFYVEVKYQTDEKELNLDPVKDGLERAYDVRVVLRRFTFIEREVKCCMRYEHDAYKEFKERAPFKNSTVKLAGREGKIVDYSMVRDSVFVQFGPNRTDQELVPLGRLARDNPGVMPADTEDWELPEPPERPGS
jgi:cell fate regulator YaaT (PSP1 superfamily)